MTNKELKQIRKDAGYTQSQLSDLIGIDSRMKNTEFKELRTTMGLSINQLAKILDVNERTIRRWEKGNWQVPQAISLAIRYIYETWSKERQHSTCH